MVLRKLCVLGLVVLGGWAVSSCAAGGADRCGNGYCEADETSITCAVDCGGGTCPNGICDIGENAATCAADCAGAICGNALCEPSENTVTCPVDCYCPNNTCDTGESSTTCPADCSGGTCGDGLCNGTETVATCPGDCTTNPVCGDGVCNGTESAASCPGDCASSSCGDGTCDANENATTCPADCGGSCTDPVCDLYPQCGCSGGQKCTLSASSRACMAAGSLLPGAACTADADCVAGAYCIGRNNAGTLGECLSFCNATTQAGCTGNTSYCLELVDGSQIPIPGAGVCTITCQPHNPSAACPSGFSCELYTHSITQVSFTDCHADVGTGTFGSACDPTNGPYCAVGYGCFNDGTPSSCYQWCTAGSSCVGATSCDTAAFDPPLSVGGTIYGVCR